MSPILHFYDSRTRTVYNPHDSSVAFDYLRIRRNVGPPCNDDGVSKEQAATHPTAPDPSRIYMPVVLFLLIVLPVIIAANVFVLIRLGFNMFTLAGLIIVTPAILGVWGRTFMKVNEMIESRQRKYKYLICADDYEEAPQPIQTTMRKIFESAESLRDNPAYRDGMFGDLDIDRVLYSASEQAVQLATLNAAKRKLQSVPGRVDEDALRRARAGLHKIGRQLDQVEAELSRAATAANGLSAKIIAAEKTRQQKVRDREAAARRDQKRADAQRLLDKAVMQTRSTSRIDTSGIGDHIESVAAGYDDATKITDKVLGPGAT